MYKNFTELMNATANEFKNRREIIALDEHFIEISNAFGVDYETGSMIGEEITTRLDQFLKSENTGSAIVDKYPGNDHNNYSQFQDFGDFMDEVSTQFSFGREVFEMDEFSLLIAYWFGIDYDTAWNIGISIMLILWVHEAEEKI